MKSSHDLILEYLQANPASSAAEISQALHLTRADIRYHISLLKAQNLIEMSASRKATHKGRPTRLYRLAASSQSNNLAGLVDALLMIQTDGDILVNDLAVHFASTIPPARQRSAQLNRLIAFLNSHGYLSRWEAYANGPRILFRNCPYAAIIFKHPELCMMDVEILSTYLGLDFHQTARIDLDQGTVPACIFKIRSKKM